MSFKYQGWLSSTWEYGGGTHQVDPLHEVVHNEVLTPLYQVLGMTHQDAVAISTPFRIAQLRAERDRLLAATDWWVLPDRSPTQEQLAYRQALRDMTNNFDATAEVAFPTKPE